MHKSKMRLMSSVTRGYVAFDPTGEEELSADQPNPSRFCSSTELLAMIGGVKETFYASSVSTQLPFWIWVQRSEWIQTNPRVGC